MKRIMSIVLCISMVMVATVSAYALNITEEESKTYTIELKMTSDEQEIEFMKEFNANLNCDYNDTSNGIKLNITNVEKADRKIFISGEGVVNLNDNEMSFFFERQQLFYTTIQGEKLYDGSIEIILECNGKNVGGILDVTMKTDYTDAILSLTLNNSLDNSQYILLYGDTFEAQIAYTQQVTSDYTLAVASSENEIVSSTSTSTKYASEITGSKFHHVTNVSDKELDGTETEKQMIIMSIAKYDPRCKQEESGSELIRVFTRSYNAVKYVDSAIQAIPYRVKASFACGKANNENPFIAIERTNPQNGSSGMLKTFSILTAYLPDATANVIANVILAFSEFTSTSVKITDHLNTGADTKAAFNVLVYDSLNLDASAAIDLPSSTHSSDAELNEKNGVAFVVDYDENSLAPASGGYARATCTATVTYRFLLGTETRFVSADTGTPTYTHILYGKNY